MSRRSEQLRKIENQKLVEKVSKIYSSCFTDVLYEAGLKKEDIEYVLAVVTEKAENLSKGYIDIDTYVVSVEEKTGVNLGVVTNDSI